MDVVISWVELLDQDVPKKKVELGTDKYINSFSYQGVEIENFLLKEICRMNVISKLVLKDSFLRFLL